MSIVLEDLTKRYEGYPVVNRVSLEVSDGQFFVLLGPSGSGKSTILRMIAGLADVDQGRILLHGRDVTGLPPQKRDVGFVFQHYALFRHMTVADNVEFALSIRRVPATRRRQRRDELLEIAGLAGLGERMPSQLSGGQQQRVALARALAHEPSVLLLDEPFGALDAKIRVDLRRSLKRVQRELNITTIFVTHDQEEAFELADLLGVMNFGRLLEVGPAEELYQRPQTEFVASFLGTANLLVGQCTTGGVKVGPLHFPLKTEAMQTESQRVQVLFRPEEVTLAPAADGLAGPPLGEAEVEQTSFAGSFQRLRLRLPRIRGVRSISPPASFGNDFLPVEAVRSQDQAWRYPLAPGDRTWLGVRRIHALTHPGMSFLVVSDRSPAAAAAMEVGGQIARLAHARVTILGCGLPPDEFQQRVQATRERLGSGLATIESRLASDAPGAAVAETVERQPCDLAVLGYERSAGLDVARQVLQAGEHHLLLVSEQKPPPTRVLICVAGGEPGKEDVLFAGRLVRHLGAEATLFSILPPVADTPQIRGKVERFLEAGARTLAILGVEADTLVRAGSARALINAEMASGAYDLLVLGAPLPDRDGRVSLAGLVGQLLGDTTGYPVLVVRSHHIPNSFARLTAGRSTGEEPLK